MQPILLAVIDKMGELCVELAKSHYDGISDTFRLKDTHGNLTPLEILKINDLPHAKQYILECPELIPGEEYSIADAHYLTAPIQFRYIVRTKEFDEKFAYDGDDLGPTYTKEYSSFKVWAPTASFVVLELEKDGNYEYIPLKIQDKGIWYGKIEGDYEGYSYIYVVKVNGKINRALDPYAYSSTPNHNRSVIVDLNKTNVENFSHCLPSFTNNVDAIVYEMHVRDFSVHENSGMANKGKFAAFLEEDTKTEKGLKSGISYLEDLGVTHIQLLPIYDFGSVDEENQFVYYNWGYDPMQYNVPEGSYATNVRDPYSRIIECKQMIQALHKHGMRVNMDVVYNHMFTRDDSSFENIVPYYYFRIGEHGEISNGSFCGNDFDSTRAMAHKFIVDSCLRWVNFYDVDGFRFDLMGIIDYQTMNKIHEECCKIKPHFMIYGEGWNMPTLLPDYLKATQLNNAKMPNIGHFSDRYRDVLKGSTNTDEIAHKGYLTGSLKNLHLVEDVLLGSCFERHLGYNYLSPNQVINYVECHDNATVYDKMLACCSKESEEIRKKRQRLILGVILMSQGVPFFHAGQEFCGTKNGHHNSYMAPDSINNLDWTLMEKNHDIVEYFKDMIKLRKQYSCLRLNTPQEIKDLASVSFENDGITVYRLNCEKDSDEFKELVIIINPNNKVVSYSLNNYYRILANESGLVNIPLYGNNLMVNPCSLLVLAR